MKNVNTKRKTGSDIIMFKDWLSPVGELRDSEDIGIEEMNMHLARFVLSSRTKYKQDDYPDSLKCIQASNSRYLSDGWYWRHRVDHWELWKWKLLQFRQ